MLARDFAYWLQGAFEVGQMTTLNEKQTQLIKNHLALVFVHDIDPSAGGPEVQDKLNEIHNETSQTNSDTDEDLNACNYKFTKHKVNPLLTKTGGPLRNDPDEPRPRC